MNKKYVIKMGKMYVKTIYISEDDINTDFINEIEEVEDEERE